MSTPNESAKASSDAANLSNTGKQNPIEAIYAGRLNALEINKETIDRLISWIKFGGSAAALCLAALGWWFGSSYSEATSNAQKAAASAFEREFFRNEQNARDFAELQKEYRNAIASLNKVESDLKGYVQLRDLVKSVENFDPLELYSSLDKEIDIRAEKDSAYSDGQGVSIEETTYDQAFRQKAAYVFQKLLAVVREDAKSGNPKFEIVTLFNAAANAAKIQMYFVSLELMEAAVAQDKSKAPENEARLIRQRLTMSRISDEEAITAIRSVIRRTTGFNVHHVLSEAYNIGLRTANPVGMAKVITGELPNDLASTSYASLITARLLYMGNTREDWEEAEKLQSKGLKLLDSEPKSVRWYQSSVREIARSR